MRMAMSQKTLEKIVVPGTRRYIPSRHRVTRDDLHRYLTKVTSTGEQRVEVIVRRVRREAYELGEYPRWFAIGLLLCYELVWPTLVMLLESVSLDEHAAAIRKAIDGMHRRYEGTLLAEARRRLAADEAAAPASGARQKEV
jgi:hypothetical protein